MTGYICLKQFERRFTVLISLFVNLWYLRFFNHSIAAWSFDVRDLTRYSLFWLNWLFSLI